MGCFDWFNSDDATRDALSGNSALEDCSLVLCCIRNVEDSMDTMDIYQLFANQENNKNVETLKSSESSKSPSPDTSQPRKYFGTEAETADVDAFINQHSSKSNLMIIITKFAEF
ncbi:uncharacterized protein LOC143893687 isoform X1 [Temnothorax americanus]|uniref:uncharacterized protein LOC143893687 isoform X1 n=2 Tax=Temnothorax americanus TaxID=1964332 RepID=UPI0040679221